MSQDEIIMGMNTDRKEERLKDSLLNHSSIKWSDDKEQVKKTEENWGRDPVE